MSYKPITVESAKRLADEARRYGYLELAEIFDSVANKFAEFNEHNVTTVEEIRKRLGEDEFWRLINEGQDL